MPVRCSETRRTPFRSTATWLARAESLPDCFISGMAPSTGMLTAHERGLLIEAMSHGFNIVSGMHEFLNDDPVFAAACVANKVGIVDVRRPRDKKDRRLFSGQIHDVTCPRIAVLGTVCAVGKRATATILTRALNERCRSASRLVWSQSSPAMPTHL